MAQTGTAQQTRPRKTMYLGDPLAEPPPLQLLEILEPYRGRHDVVVALLQQIQDLYGYLPERSLRYAARELGIPLPRIYGVATFYNQFCFTPPGRFIIQVCRGTACHVAGSGRLLAAIEESLGVGEDESTPDGLFTLRTVACLGCCSLAPVIVLGRDVHGAMAQARVEALLAGYRARPNEGVP